MHNPFKMVHFDFVAKVSATGMYFVGKFKKKIRIRQERLCNVIMI